MFVSFNEVMATKESLIKDYLFLGRDKGFLNISLQDIATYEGIKKPSILSHFSSYEELKKQALDYCLTVLEQNEINVSFSKENVKEVLEDLLSSFFKAFSNPILSSYLSLLNQMQDIDKTYKKYSDNLDMMIKSRLTVALDFSNQRSWTDISDTDSLAEILCPFIRSILTKKELPDWELSNMIKVLSLTLTSSLRKEFRQE